MNRASLQFAVLAIACACTTLHAQQVPGPGALAPQPAPEGLLPNERAKDLINADPRVVQARKSLDAARHSAQALAAGPYEWTAKAASQRRRYDNGAPGVREWSVGVERTVRIGGKAGVDHELGEVGVELAEAKLGEARHESARELLELVVGIQAAERTRALWAEQLGFAQANANAAATRRRAGDASALDQNVAAADVAEVQRQLSTAANEGAKLRARFAARYGQQAVPALPSVDPVPLTPEGPVWRERIFAQSDAVKVVELELRQAELTARRRGADRLPDPTIGVHAGSEAGGAERIVGITISVPLGGTHRNALQREALEQAEAARAGLDRARQDLEAEVAQTLADAAGSLERWRYAEQAAQASAQNARLMQRAYTLGETDLQAVLLARRQSVEAAIGTVQARTDALRARYRLLIDAHLIWGLHED